MFGDGKCNRVLLKLKPRQWNSPLRELSRSQKFLSLQTENGDSMMGVDTAPARRRERRKYGFSFASAVGKRDILLNVPAAHSTIAVMTLHGFSMIQQ
jgi:hypothetical protein